MRPNSSDRNEFYQIMGGFEYCELFNIYKKGYEINVLDVGGNIGLFTLRLNENYNLLCSVVVEPDADNLIILKKNIKANNLEKKTSIIELALYSEDNINVFFDDSKNHDAKSISNTHTKVSVKTCSLKSLLEMNKKIKYDIMKIDIEGGEYNLLTIENQILFAKINCIVIEYHKGYDKILSYFEESKKIVSHIIFNRDAGLLYLVSK